MSLNPKTANVPSVTTVKVGRKAVFMAMRTCFALSLIYHKCDDAKV